MARDRDDDSRDDSRDDDRPRRRRDDDAPKKGGKGWLIALIIVGGVLIICGGVAATVVYFVTQAVSQVVASVKEGVEQFAGSVQATTEATTFIDLLETAPDSAYDRTTDAFKKTTSKEQFQKLLKDNPVLTEQHYHTQGSLPTPTGTTPNRKVTTTYTIIAGVDPNPTGTNTTGTGKTLTTGTGKTPATSTKPTVPPATTMKAKSVTVTLNMAEQPDKTWKVDGFTVQ